MKTCTRCKTAKDLSEFWQGSYYCKDCNRLRRLEYYAKNPEARIRDRKKVKDWQKVNLPTIRATDRKRYLKTRYNMTIEQYETILQNQDYKCAICRTGTPGRDRRYFDIDHDHSCCDGHAVSCGECIRGLLCADCNYLLGICNEDPIILSAAIDYLNLYTKESSC